MNPMSDQQSTRLLKDGSVVIGVRLLTLASKHRMSDKELFFLLYLYLKTEMKLGKPTVIQSMRALAKQFNVAVPALKVKLKKLEEQEIIQIKPNGHKGLNRLVFREKL